MPQSWKPFILGVVSALLIGAIILFGMDHRALVAKTDNDKPDIRQSAESTTESQPAYPPIPPDAVKIQPLPPLMQLTGSVKFEGKREFPQKISGTLARNLVIVNFKATGENANRSAIRIYWTDGTMDAIPPGTSNLMLPPGKLAKQIVVYGYAMHERKILKDSSRPGTLEWEIRYEAATN